MTARILALLRARLASGPRGGLPVATWFGHAVIAAFFCGLVTDILPPFAYGLFALTLTGALLAIPLLGELGWLLRVDPAEDWVATLPCTPTERRLARTLHLALLLGGLALASLLPGALFLPAGTPLVLRLAFPLLGLGLATFLAAALLFVQSAFAGRAEGLLVLVQTLLVVAVVVGLVSGLGHVSALARVPHPGDEGGGFLWLCPPAWFALPLASLEGEPARAWLPLAVAAASAVLLVSLPAPRAPERGRREPLLARLLRPLRWLAARAWVRPGERAGFDLVYDALPLEREVVLRTYPMIGIPLAFLLVAALGPEKQSLAREGLFAVLLFTAGIYLPVLLVQVPASASSAARWLHECAPVTDGELAAGAVKAIAVRFLVPLHVALAWLAWLQLGPDFVLRLALPGALVSLLICQRLYPVCVSDRPLSVPPDELRADLDWLGLLSGLALGLTVAAVLALRFLSTPAALGLSLLLALAAAAGFRRLRGWSVPG